MVATHRERLIAALDYLSPPDREWVKLRLAMSGAEGPVAASTVVLNTAPTAAASHTPPAFESIRRDNERLIQLARRTRADAATTVARSDELLARIRNRWSPYYWRGPAASAKMGVNR